MITMHNFLNQINTLTLIKKMMMAIPVIKIKTMKVKQNNRYRFYKMNIKVFQITKMKYLRYYKTMKVDLKRLLIFCNPEGKIE